MPAEYPFSGMDMLQNSIAQLVGELRNVGAAIGQSARSLNSAGLQQVSQFSSSVNAVHGAAMAGAHRVMAPSDGGGNFFRETFSSQFNKPSLWSRDLVALSGLKDYEDMYGHEVQRYARQNMSHRMESAGVGALRAGAFGGSMLIKSTLVGLPVGLALDYTVGEFAKNVEQKHDWWRYLDKAGSNNVLMGKGAGAYGGWGDESLNDMSRWLSTQDKTWYGNRESMKYEELQSTVMSAEMQGYFFNTVDTADFKQKVTKLVQDTKEIMKTMKMANDEAAALIGELSYFGYKDASKTIKDMNRTAAMTGLSFSEVKSYGMEYAKSSYDAFTTDKDVSTQLINSLLQKYDKLTMGGAEEEARGINRMITSPLAHLIGTKYDPNTGHMVPDEAALTRLAGSNPIDTMQEASAKLAALQGAAGGDHTLVSRMLMELSVMGPTLMQSVTPDVAQRYALGQNMSRVRTIFEYMASSDPTGKLRKALDMGGDDPFEWLADIDETTKRMAAGIYAKQYGGNMGDVLKMLNANTPGQGVVHRTGPRSIDEISSPFKLVGGFLGMGKHLQRGPGLSAGYLNDSNWSWGEALTGMPEMPGWWEQMQGAFNEAFTPGSRKYYSSMTDPKFSLLGPQARLNPAGHALFMWGANDLKHDVLMEDIQRVMAEKTGVRAFKKGDDSHAYIYALMARENYVDADADAMMRNTYRNLYRGRGMSTVEAYDAAEALPGGRHIRKQIYGNDQHGEWLENYGRYKSINFYGGQGEAYMNSVTGTSKAAEIHTLMGALHSREGAAEIEEYLQGGGEYNSLMLSPELVSRNVDIFKTRNADLADWQLSIKRDVLTAGLKLPASAQLAFAEAASTKDYGKFEGANIRFARKSGLSAASNRIYLDVARALNPHGMDSVQLPGALALDAITSKSQLMGEIATSPYAELFTTSAVTNLYNQLADPTSSFSQRDNKSQAEIIAQAAAAESRRQGKGLTRAQISDMAGVAQRSLPSDTKTAELLAMEFNRAQNTVKGAVDTSNIHLAKIATGIGGSSEGNALRVVMYKPGQRGNLEKDADKYAMANQGL